MSEPSGEKYEGSFTGPRESNSVKSSIEGGDSLPSISLVILVPCKCSKTSVRTTARLSRGFPVLLLWKACRYDRPRKISSSTKPGILLSHSSRRDRKAKKNYLLEVGTTHPQSGGTSDQKRKTKRLKGPMISET